MKIQCRLNYFLISTKQLKDRAKEGKILLIIICKLREQARWTKSRDVIGYPSGQDGAILPARDYRCIPQEKLHRKPYKKSYIDQVCSVMVAGY